MEPAGAATADIIRALKRSRSLTDIGHIHGGSREELITSLVAILAAEEISLRWKAAVALCGIGSPAVGPLICSLAGTKPFVRGSIAWILGTIGDPSAVDGLIPLLADASDEVRRETAEALVRSVMSARGNPCRMSCMIKIKSCVQLQRMR
jgi:HEAT repeat protein